LKTVLLIATTATLVILAGCKGAVKQEEPLPVKKELLKKGKEVLTVDFQEGQSLRYRFVCSRDIELDWDPTRKRGKPNEQVIDKSSESLEMVVAYTPTKVDPFGLTTINATCESVKVKRSKGRSGRDTSKDAVENFAGKTFTLTVNPSGKIEDYSQLDELIREIGETAFRPTSRMGRIKEPDMIGDFIATQWFLWDSVSSIEKPIEGISVGQSWGSKLSVPTPMVMRKARDVSYSLEEIRQSEEGRLAVIRSCYTLADSVPSGWPVPYTGRFNMSGPFGFFRGYEVLELKGNGEELFNIDSGRIEKYKQQYRMRLEAALPAPLGPKPLITINQNLAMQLLK